jgi:hypothetical protein
MNVTVKQTSETENNEFVRIPGLLRRWEIEQLIEPGPDFHIEAAGEAEDGTPLFAVYKQEKP